MPGRYWLVFDSAGTVLLCDTSSREVIELIIFPVVGVSLSILSGKAHRAIPSAADGTGPQNSGSA